MRSLDFGFFGLCALLVLLGGLATIAAKNPIRGAMGLLSSILGIAGMYLMLSAEFLAAIQLIVYAGAVIVLFLFVIMLLGPSSTTSPQDARTKIPRYFGAGVFLVVSLGALMLLLRGPGELTQLAAPRQGLGTIEGLGRELFTVGIVPFELSGALLLIAVVGAVAVARGKQIDPTLLRAPEKAPSKEAAS